MFSIHIFKYVNTHLNVNCCSLMAISHPETPPSSKPCHWSISVMALVWVDGSNMRRKGARDDEHGTFDLIFTRADLTIWGGGTPNQQRYQESKMAFILLPLCCSSGHLPRLKYLWKWSLNMYGDVRISSMRFLIDSTKVGWTMPPLVLVNWPETRASL